MSVLGEKQMIDELAFQQYLNKNEGQIEWIYNELNKIEYLPKSIVGHNVKKLKDNSKCKKNTKSKSNNNGQINKVKNIFTREKLNNRLLESGKKLQGVYFKGIELRDFCGRAIPLILEILGFEQEAKGLKVIGLIAELIFYFFNN